MRRIDPRMAKLGQKTQVISTLMVMAMVILLIQLWLLTIALEEFMASKGALAIPTFGASIFCFMVNLWLLRTLSKIDRRKD